LLTSCSTSDETGCYKSNLFSFSLVGSLDTSAQSIYAWGISKSGDFLYVNGGPNLGIIDVSDPANPSLRSNLATPSGQYSTSGIVVGPFWVICGGSVLVHVFDVSDLDTPTLAGTYDEAYGFCNEMIYGDGKLFVSTGNAQSEILKISDPTSPTRLGGHEGYGCGSCGPGSVFYKSDRMYLGYRDTYKEFRVLDVSDPTSPSLLGNYSNSGGVSGIVVVGDKAFLAANAEGLDIVDLSNLGAISRIHLMTFSEEVYKVVVYKKDILVVLGEDNVFLVDVSNPTSPDILTTYELPNGSMGNQGQALVDGDYIYVGSSGLLVVLKP